MKKIKEKKMYWAWQLRETGGGTYEEFAHHECIPTRTENVSGKLGSTHILQCKCEHSHLTLQMFFFRRFEPFKKHSMFSFLDTAYFVYAWILDCICLGVHSTVSFPVTAICHQCLTMYQEWQSERPFLSVECF